jgi:5-(carboxyamino)imidazole ribonucleotide synthase
MDQANNPFNNAAHAQRVGILGGGQLGCLLAEAALKLGLEPMIFAEATSPAAFLYPGRHQKGVLTDEAALRTFFKTAPLVTFENEFVDTALLARAASDLNIRFEPSLDAIREVQDKLRQKEILVEAGLPTAPFMALSWGTEPEIKRFVTQAFTRFPNGAVFKWSRLGYDGKGVCLAKNTEQGRSLAEDFCKASLARGTPVYAEERIAFRRELAIVACRSTTGEFAAFPLVISEQRDGICRRVSGPAVAQGVSEALETLARDHARRVGERLGLTGSYALELFETEKEDERRLLINELAPRVHNTGHYTQDACPSSQFENHWRAITGLPLGRTHVRGGFAMLNLLGPPGLSVEVSQNPELLPFSGPRTPLQLHWYSKTGIRPGRKLGHVNGVVSSADQLPALLKLLDSYQADWTESLQRIRKEK